MASETTRFVSAHANAVRVSRTGNQRLSAGRIRFNRTLPLRVTATRASTLRSQDSAKGCRPNFDALPSDYGVKARTFVADVYGARTCVGLDFEFIRAGTFGYRPLRHLHQLPTRPCPELVRELRPLRSEGLPGRALQSARPPSRADGQTLRAGEPPRRRQPRIGDI